MRPVIVLTMWLLCASWASAAGVDWEPQPLQGVLADLPRLLPGWSLTAPPRVWTAAELADYLKQASAACRTCRHQFALSARYQTHTPGQVLAVDLFVMADELDAFGVYAEAIGQSSETVDLAVAAAWHGGALHWWRGPLYARLTPTPSGPATRPAVISAAGALAESLSVPSALPAMIRLMPTQRLAPDTLRYYHDPFWGQPFLRDALVGDYLGAGGKLQLLLLRTADPSEAVQRLAQVRAWLTPGGTQGLLLGLGAEARWVKSQDYGLCYLLRERRYVVVALRIEDRTAAEGLLRVIGTQIRIGEQ